MVYLCLCNSNFKCYHPEPMRLGQIYSGNLPCITGQFYQQTGDVKQCNAVHG